ncbi:2-acylglycerol O-acyltransferase 1-like isoform X2 [Zophobas morio]
MKILGIEFAPLNVPLERRLQTLAAAAWFVVLAFGSFFGIIITGYLFFTSYWWLSLLYLLWIYIDSNTCEEGGRYIPWVQNLKWWYYLKKYFPTQLHLVPDFTLDPKRNYLFCCFPHGVLPVGPFTTIQSPHSEFHKLFPNFSVKLVILSQNFLMPLLRELAYGLGCISASSKSLDYVLSSPEGGQVVILMPGGAVEAYNSRPGQYKFVVKNRKGFVKVALKNGSPIVPVISFGEPDLFDQVQGPTIRKIQEFLRGILGIAPVIFSGRGFFQYSFGVVPRRKPIKTVVGTPIELSKVENPTREQIEDLHGRFKQELVKLFEEYKYKFLENPEKTQLELE